MLLYKLGKKNTHEYNEQWWLFEGLWIQTTFLYYEKPKIGEVHVTLLMIKAQGGQVFLPPAPGQLIYMSDLTQPIECSYQVFESWDSNAKALSLSEIIGKDSSRVSSPVG